MANRQAVSDATSSLESFRASDAYSLDWSAIVAGAFVAGAVSFVLISFGSTLGLSVASPSSTWRDTSAVLALLGGLWLLLTALVSFGLGAYLAGRLRRSWRGGAADEVGFRDGVHGMVVWGLAVMLAAALAFTIAKPIAGTGDSTGSTSATSEPLIAFELDRLFRSDRAPTDPADSELRAQAARIITSGLGHSGIAQDDRAYLVRLVQTRTGLNQADAETRVNQAITDGHDAISKARRSAVLLGFMIAASLLLGLVAAWLAGQVGGEHRDNDVSHVFWRRWEVDRYFVIR